MSKDIIVLAPNGRRQKIHCTPDTSILQVLEDVCSKQGFQPSDYDLKHHNHILDLTTTIRFSNLPNKATLEMVEADTKRRESNVTIGLQLEDGERRTADFSPTTTLYDLVISLAPSEIGLIQQPTILYMRQEVVGESALKGKTLRQLGLIKGRAILRLLNKQEEARQANVSAFYRKSVIDTQVDKKAAMTITEPGPTQIAESASTEVSQTKHETYDQSDSLKKFKEEIRKELTKEEKMSMPEKVVNEEPVVQSNESEETMDVDIDSSTSRSTHTQENLERRLKIDEEVTFLGNYKAIAFKQPDSMDHEPGDLPDDFYELSVEEVRKLYHDLQQNRLSLENTPLMLASTRDDNHAQSSQEKLNLYKNVVVRIQFPDQIILQGIFSPSNTIEDVTNFIKDHLHYPHEKFDIFTTPIKESLEPKMTLLDAKFVPCVHMHFKWSNQDTKNQLCLKEEIYSKLTAPDAASILASKYRAPSRSRQDNGTHNNQKSSKPSTSKASKVPRWFKN
ncbi:unnamed protein product [Arctia plantaginis]|uniref:TUG ubiquitin-like domain-containing protein n=1 Tax=Arctia plantaginis TaxID=874455 RepID=A0A8S1AY21_ARCPL|nr:unnamed protein product [Arctia plantaginis]CAB3259918.1 unnamed protein product [Arctia plantaginis]